MNADDNLKIFCEQPEPLVELGEERLDLFGSIVRGDESPHSNFDFFVQFAQRGKL